MRMIFLDLDGVLADFLGGAFAAHGRRDLRQEQVTHWRAPIDLVSGGDDGLFWGPIRALGGSFWADLRPYPWMKTIYSLCQAAGRVVIATSPERTIPASLTGKALWIDRHLGDQCRYMLGRDKELLAGAPGAVLIDDKRRNCEAFRLAGGRAILFPQPWNWPAGSQLPDRVDYVFDQLTEGGDCHA